MSFSSQCGTCQKMFTKTTEASARRALRLHCNRAHGDPLAAPHFKVKCDHCDKVFSSETSEHHARNHLRQHLRVRHPEHYRTSGRNWTKADQELLTNRAAQLHHETGQPLLDCLRLVQEVLPAEKRRTRLHQSSVREKIWKMLDARIAATKPEPAPPAAEIVHTLTVEVPVREPVEKTLRALGTPALLAELFTRLFDRLDRLEHALARQAVSSPASNGHAHRAQAVSAPPPEPAGPRRPRIAIVGLFKDQFEHVRSKLSGAEVDLLWIDKDQSATHYPRVDAVVVEKHCRHKWFNEAQSAVGNNRVFFAEGSSSVTQRCYDFLSRKPLLAGPAPVA
ncbi:MAG: zinc finger BED domain-containing protein [Verrucomicrobia bacterium]|nr:zinc finger BED domain-containing protein [Verrucomicrobiota bacterium]